MTIRHPKISVQLIGEDGNAFTIMGRCSSAARRAGLSRQEIDLFKKEAMSGDYDHLIQTALRWFHCS